MKSCFLYVCISIFVFFSGSPWANDTGLGKYFIKSMRNIEGSQRRNQIVVMLFLSLCRFCMCLLVCMLFLYTLSKYQLVEWFVFTSTCKIGPVIWYSYQLLIKTLLSTFHIKPWLSIHDYISMIHLMNYKLAN